MLTDKLRDGAQSKVFKLIFWVIILSFVFAGVGNYLIPRLDTSPAKVGEAKITEEQWRGEYQNQVRYMQMYYGANINNMLEDPKFVQAMRMRVLNDIIDNVALNSVIHEEGVRIGDEQVKDNIRKNDSFKKDGKFNNELFLATVRNWGSSPDYYAEQLRTQLAAQTVIDPIAEVSLVTFPSEVENLAKLLAKKRTVDLYSINNDHLLKNTSVTEDEAKAFYETHQDLFKDPAKVQFNYVVLSVDALKKDVSYDDAALENFYNMNQNEFEVPSKRKASQILIKKDVENFEQKAKDALAALKGGQSFETVGAEYSDDPDFGKSHGDLGELEKGSLSKELDIALFDMTTAGSYSNVVVDEFGAHILRLDAIIEAYVPPFADIKDEVAKKYVDEKALEIFNEKSAKLTDISYEQPDSLDPAAEAVGAAVLSSGPVSIGDSSLVWPLNNEDVLKAAFNAENRTSNQNSNVISLGTDSCIVLNVTEYTEAKTLEFDAVKDKAFETAKFDKVRKSAREILKGIANKIKEGKEVTLDDAVSLSKDVVVSKLEPKEGLSSRLVFSVFAIPNQKNASVIARNDKVLTLAVLKSETVDESEDLTADNQQARTFIVQNKMKNTESMLRSSARELSDITYNESVINRVNQEVNSED